MDINKCLEDIKKENAKYINDSNYVFKSTPSEIIVLGKLKNTMTNEKRSDIYCEKKAKYRGDTFYVVSIFDKCSPHTKKTTTETYFKKIFIYTVDQVVSVPDFDTDVENISSNGIHYFKCIEAAFFYELLYYFSNKIENGKVYEHHSNGRLLRECGFKNGLKDGYNSVWSIDGRINELVCFKEGRMYGKKGYWWINSSSTRTIFFFENGKYQKALSSKIDYAF